jgi:hypothetical protein
MAVLIAVKIADTPEVSWHVCLTIGRHVRDESLIVTRGVNSHSYTSQVCLVPFHCITADFQLHNVSRLEGLHVHLVLLYTSFDKSHCVVFSSARHMYLFTVACET